MWSWPGARSVDRQYRRSAYGARISYFGIDGNQVHTDHARIKALSIGMKSASCHCSLLEDLAAVLTEERGFNLATLTNTFHELDPLVVPDLLVDVLGRLDAEGSLFVYDMRTLEKSELGAITWGHDEIQRLVNAWCETLKSRSRPPKVARWRHARVEGWSFELRRDSLAITNADLPTARGELLRQLSIALNLKLQDTMALLNALTNPGIKTPEEDAIKTRELYNFWGLTYRTGRSQ